MSKHARTKSARLAEKLLHIRLALGLSQSGMLEHLGFSEELFRSNVSQYELGTREPALPVLLAYARSVGISTDVLIDDKLDLPNKLTKPARHQAARETTPRRRPRKSR